MSLAAQLCNFTTLTAPELSRADSPAARERKKGAQQRAEDFIYTLNHAVTCLSLTDFLIAPFFSTVFGWNICGHDHGHQKHDHHAHHHDHHHGHHHPHEPTSFRQRIGTWWKELRTSPVAYLKKQYPGFKEWAIGEAVGDIGAVPVTLAVQHFTPGMMEGIQRGLEPLVGGIMRRRAERAAERWADKHGIARDAEEVITRARELYAYEIRHLPQMVMWTLSSVAINYGVMKARNPTMELGTFAKGKAAGAAITAGLVFGTRTLVPDKAHKWDETMGRRVVVPVSKKVGRLFGIDEREIDEYHARKQSDATTQRLWADRMTNEAACVTQAVATAR